MTSKHCNIRVSGLHKVVKDLSFTGRVKTYPGGGVEIMACSAPVFRRSGWEESGGENRPALEHRNRRTQESNSERAMRRARAKVRDMALCTPFKWFVTLTIDPEKMNRYDMAEITRHLNHWLDNQVRRHGLTYILVAEHHKDQAIHFHGFFNDALKAVDSGTISLEGKKAPVRPRSRTQRERLLAEGGHPVYNLPAWGWGFTTAIEIYGNYNKAVSYICKYIGKEGKKAGGRWYYSGGDIQRPTITYEDIEYREVAQLEGAFMFAPKDARAAFAMLRHLPEYEKEEENRGENQDRLHLLGDLPSNDLRGVCGLHDQGPAAQAPDQNGDTAGAQHTASRAVGGELQQIPGGVRADRKGGVLR